MPTLSPTQLPTALQSQPQQSFPQQAGQFGTQLLHGLGDTAAGAVGGLVQLGGNVINPIVPGAAKQAQQSAALIRQDAADSAKAPNTSAGNAGYIAGSALGMIPQMFPAARGQQIGSDVAQVLTKGATAPKIVQQAATKGLEAIGGGLGYTAVSGDTSPQNAAQNIALGVGLEAVPPAMRAGAAGADKAAQATKEAYQANPILSNQGGYVNGRLQEVSDQPMKVKGSGAQQMAQGQAVPLNNLVNHPAMKSDYPQLFDKNTGLKVAYNPDPKAMQSIIDHDTGTILISKAQAPDISTDAGKGRLAEELQHAIDATEGRPSGTTPAFEAAKLVPQENVDAAQVVAKLQPEVQNLKALRNKGQMTDAEYNARPEVRAYNAAKLKANVVPAPHSPEALQAYNNNPGERLAQTVRSRVGLNQKEIDANPQDLSYVQKTNELQPRVAASASPLDPLKNEDGTLRLPTKPARSQNVVTPEDFAKQGLGMSDAEIKAAQKGSPIAAENDAALAREIKKEGIGPKAGEKTAKATKAAIDRQRAAMENTDANPVKFSLDEVKDGDYQKARVNGQLVSNPVENAGRQTLNSYDRLSKSEKTNARYMIEDPSLAKSSAAKEFVQRFRYFDDLRHSVSQSLGGNTFYKQNHFTRTWDLSDPEMAAKYEEIANQQGLDARPDDFKGLNHQQEVFPSIKAGEAAGFHLKYADAREDLIHQIENSSSILKKQALVKGFTEADKGAQAAALENKERLRSFDLRNGKNLPLSQKGLDEMRRAYDDAPKARLPLKSYRTVNRVLKRTLLSISQFHPININILKALPTLAGTPKDLLTGDAHPLLAGRGALNTFLSINKKYSDSLMQHAMQDGTVENAARIGTPIRAGSDFSTSGKLSLQSATGERMIFDQQIPAMHIEMVRGLVADLKARGISLDSPEARAAGNRVNEIMGFVNVEARGLDQRIQRGLGDVALAPQFTRAKLATVKGAASERGVAGNYARRAVVGNYTAEVLLATAVGAAVSQRSDDLRDILLRSLVHPSIPTPFQDSKGNTIELGLPQNYASEVLGLGLNLQRGDDDHLHLQASPSKVPGNVAQYGRSRLAEIPSDALKLGTNTDFGNKPLYDPNASPGVKAEQAATTLTTSHLPIGVQGIPYLSGVENHLPGSVQQVLNVGQGGINPLIKSSLSAVGITPRTDKTVDKGQQTATYFDAVNQAKQGLNRQAQGAVDLWTGSKKNPVTGQYEVQPTVEDSIAKASALLQNPTALDHLIAMNQKVQSSGGSIDPLWNQPRDNIVKYLQYQTMPVQSADRTDWSNKNPWYAKDPNGLMAQRDAFFNSLPPADPNKPNAPIEFPTPDSQTKQLMDAYYNPALTSQQRGQLIQKYPEIQDQFNKQDNYYNQVRTAQGYAANKQYPNATPQIENFITQYNAADKAARAQMRNANPQAYQNMISYYDSADLYNIGKQSALTSLQGEPNTTNTQLKAIQSLARDIYQNPDGTYSVVPAGWMQGLSNGSSGGGSSRRKGGGMKISSSAFKLLPHMMKAPAAYSAMAKLQRQGTSVHASGPKRPPSGMKAMAKTQKNPSIAQAKKSSKSKGLA